MAKDNENANGGDDVRKDSEGVAVKARRKSPGLLKRILPVVRKYKTDNGRNMTFAEIDRAFPDLFPLVRTRDPRRGSKMQGKYKKGDKLPDGVSPAERWFYSLIQRAESQAAQDKYRALYDAIAVASGLGTSASKETADELADNLADDFDDIIG